MVLYPSDCSLKRAKSIGPSHSCFLAITESECSPSRSNQATTSTVEPWEIVWASVYNRRFPDPVVTSLLQQIGPGGVDMWGGEPWDPTGDPDEPGM